MAPSPARRPAGKVRAISSDTPTSPTLNLDTLEREGGPDEPFVVVLNGKRLVFSDPQEIAWQDLMELDDPEEFARLCLPEDQRDLFLTTEIPVWKLNKVMSGFKDHYGLGSSGNAGA